MALFSHVTVLVRGGGDLASGVIYRLYRAGFSIVVTELSCPALVRHTVSYGAAVYQGRVEVQGIEAVLCHDPAEVDALIAARKIAVMVDPDAALISRIRPLIVVDARMEKQNHGTTMQDAPLVIALGPGYTAGVDCHAVIETNRGHRLGQVYWQGSAEPDTGEPGMIEGMTHSRVLRAPADGRITPLAQIGDMIKTEQQIARMGAYVIRAPFDGILRGLIHESVSVRQGMKIGDLDPRARLEHCYTISDKSLAVGGGTVEAVLSAPQLEAYLMAKR